VDKTIDGAGTITASTDGTIVNVMWGLLLPGGDDVLDVLVGGITSSMVDKFARITGSDATTTGQVLVNITGLSILLAANTVNEFEAVLSVTTTAVTTGCQYAVQFSQAGASVEAQIIGSSTATATESERISALNTATSAFLTTSGETGQILIKGILTTGGNAGNLTIQHLKVTSGTSTVKINSFLKARRIA